MNVEHQTSFFYEPSTINHELRATSRELKAIHLLTVILVALLLLTVIPAHAASTTNVSLERDLYREMELWAAEGLIGSNMYSFRPFARSEVGNQLAAALHQCGMMKKPSAACKDIQDRYAKLFEAEIAEARSPDGTTGTFLKPVESFSVAYHYLDGPFSVFNKEGIPYNNGHNALVQIQSHARLGKVISVFVEPVFIFNERKTVDNDSDRTEVRLHKGYAKLTLMNVELEVGRDSLWWGPSTHGSLLMSNNTEPFDMIKLSNPEPVLLPWIFSYLGPAQFNVIFSQLNDERTGAEQANPFLYGLRLGLKPLPILELGVSQLAMFGGPGRRDKKHLRPDHLYKILYSRPSDNNDETNQQFSFDWALNIPGLKKYLFVIDGIKFTGEWGGEDSGIPPNRRAYILGLAFFKPFTLDGAVIRGEYANLSPESVPDVWYNHPDYPMRYEGRVFGHHAGADAEDIFVEWSHSFDRFFYKVAFDRERSGIKTEPYRQIKNQYFGEIGYRVNPHASITLRYAFEDIKNAGYVQDVRQRNHFMGVEAALFF